MGPIIGWLTVRVKRSSGRTQFRFRASVSIRTSDTEGRNTVRSTIAISPEAIHHRVAELAQYGRYGDSGVWRPAYSPAWREAQEHVAAWCREIGLATRWDAVGNVWGRLEGTAGGKAIVTGSHIDSQCPGGRYDGALGVIAGILALHALAEQIGPPKRPIEVVSFCQEEASRFPTADKWGSRAVSGAITQDDLELVRDFDGQSIGDVMREVGLDPDTVPTAKRVDIDAFIELHIEQGAVLEQEGVPVGIVRGITGRRRVLVRLRGREDHAGTCPMDLRRDAMAGAAEIILGVIDTAHRMGRPAVTTVGRISAEPNAPSIVPKEVNFTIDARHPGLAEGNLLYGRHEAFMRNVAARRDLELEIVVAADQPPCPADQELIDLLDTIAHEDELDVPIMDSAAGHDASRMADVARMAMIFVRSAGGRSHTPDEFTTDDDAAEGIRLLAGMLHRLAY